MHISLIEPGINTDRNLEVSLHNIGSAWTDCTRSLNGIAGFVLIYNYLMVRGISLNIPLSRLAISRLTTCWRSVNILAIYTMQWRITMVSHSQHMIKKTTRQIPALINIAADSGSCIVLEPISQPLRPTMCFIGTLVGTMSIWMLLKFICCVK